jgi:2-phosphoglycerate kinase
MIESILFPEKNKSQDNTDMSEAEILWPAVKSFVEDKARWENDFVLDGIHLLPKYLDKISEERKPNIRIIFLVKKNENKILEGFEK